MTDATEIASEDIADDDVVHIGVLHKSGRYPWGSGKDPYQRSSGFTAAVTEMRRNGMTKKQIADALGISTTELVAYQTIAKNTIQKADISRAMTLREKGMSNSAIGRLMGKNESSVRALLAADTQEKNDILTATANVLKQQIEEKKYLDVGAGTEHYLGVADTKLKVAVQMLQEEGYKLHYINVPQLGTSHETKLKVLTKGDVDWKELNANRDNIATVAVWSDDGGKSYAGKLNPPVAVEPSRVQVRYGSEGGGSMDGVIELRRDAPDLSMGNARYAQVRIAVGKDRYLKGMAIYADDLPKGVDIRFNTNKESTGNPLEAMKKQKSPEERVQPNNPFGSAISRQNRYVGSDGKDHQGPLNIVNEEGKWNDWSSNLSTQFLSKQPVTLAREQLNVRADMLQNEYEDISRLTNPSVKIKLLRSFADSADASAVHLKAAGLPRTATKVILPINSLKDNEIYAPSYDNGTRVALVRHPHGGIFEIPELTVNNRNKDAKRIMPNAIDAVGINANVAKRLSGADFDGDTVLVIPNNQGKVKSAPAIKVLKEFDPQTKYPPYDGMKTIDGGTWNAAKRAVEFPPGKSSSGANKQHKMGDISNLITDMQIHGGASQAEVARAVKHSMVVIDAEKHSLDFKQSYLDNNIAELKKKYQGDGKGSVRAGASTLISRAQADIRVPKYKPRSAKEGGAIDKVTGELKKAAEPESFIDSKTGQKVIKTEKTTRAAATNDLHTLVSANRQPIELVYADYGNKMKALANQARKEMVNTAPMRVNKVATVTYKPEVAKLKADLNTALKNAPLERNAQVLANALVKARTESNPGLDKSDVKKIKNQALDEARSRVGATKTKIPITDRQWEAIQAGAISPNILDKILNNTDLDRIKELATPRTKLTMDAAKIARAKSMLASGYTQAEVAAALGVSVSTINNAVNPK